MLSSEHEDLVAICDRVLVFRNGSVAAELSADRLTNEELLHAASFGEDREPRTA
jgi:ABC-type sugar transport system ATPase subunit